MQEQLFQKLRRDFSPDRLDAYRQSGDSNFDVICNYLWNIRLCESLYPALQTLEVALRNTIHTAASRRYSTAAWFDPPVSPLKQQEQDSILNAKDELQKAKKTVEPCRVVPELTFGFWTSLLNSRYERVFWPWMLADAFPCMPRQHRTRKTVSARLNIIRKLRNRVFHHERIVHWINLPQRHKEIVEAINWISPDWGKLLMATDNFPHVYATGPNPVRCQAGQSLYSQDYSI